MSNLINKLTVSIAVTAIIFFSLGWIAHAEFKSKEIEVGSAIITVKSAEKTIAEAKAEQDKANAIIMGFQQEK